MSRNRWNPQHGSFPGESLLERFARLVMRSDSIAATEMQELSRHFLIRPHGITFGPEADVDEMTRNDRWRNTLGRVIRPRMPCHSSRSIQRQIRNH
jgi:hypothetical protein